MDKPTKKRTYYNEDILIKLKGKYGYSLDYIRKCLRGDRPGEMADILKKEYKTLQNEALKAIEQTSNSLKP